MVHRALILGQIVASAQQATRLSQATLVTHMPPAHQKIGWACVVELLLALSFSANFLAARLLVQYVVLLLSVLKTKYLVIYWV